MHRIILDTNVVISSILGRSYPYLIVHRLVFESKVHLSLSNEVIHEFESVVGYKKFAKIDGFLPDAEIVLNGLKRQSIIIKPSSHV